MNNLLLPTKFKLIGWCILIPATILGIILIAFNYRVIPLKAKVFVVYAEGFMSDDVAFKFVETDITITILGMLFIVGALLVSFSREKREDEFISKLRLSSLSWAVLINYLLLLLSFMFIYDMSFLYVMMYNMFTVLIIFILRFNFILYKSSKAV